MVLIYSNLGHATTRYIEGIDALISGDWLYVKEKFEGRRRICCSGGFGGKGYMMGINLFDYSSTERLFFQADKLDFGGSTMDYAEIPTIVEWGVLYESRGIGERRQFCRELLIDGFVRGELFLNEAAKKSPLDMLNDRKKQLLLSELFSKSLEVVKKIPKEKFPSPVLEHIRVHYPIEELEKTYEQAYEQQRKGTTNHIYTVLDDWLVKNVPYMPLKILS